MIINYLRSVMAIAEMCDIKKNTLTVLLDSLLKANSFWIYN